MLIIGITLKLHFLNVPCLCLITSAHLFFKGLNPNIIYYIDGNSNFSIVGGYLFMTQNLTEATLNLQVR